MTATIETISKKIDGQTTELPTATNTTTGDFFTKSSFFRKIISIFKIFKFVEIP